VRGGAGRPAVCGPKRGGPTRIATPNCRRPMKISTVQIEE